MASLKQYFSESRNQFGSNQKEDAVSFAKRKAKRSKKTQYVMRRTVAGETFIFVDSEKHPNTEVIEQIKI